MEIWLNVREMVRRLDYDKSGNNVLNLPITTADIIGDFFDVNVYDYYTDTFEDVVCIINNGKVWKDMEKEIKETYGENFKAIHEVRQC